MILAWASPFNTFKPEFTIVIAHSLQAASCCRNSRLVVNKDDLKSVKIKENCHVLVNQFQGNFQHKTLSCRKIKWNCVGQRMFKIHGEKKVKYNVNIHIIFMY